MIWVDSSRLIAPFQGAFRHASVGQSDFYFRHKRPQSFGHDFEMFDTRADVKCLSAPEMLAHDRFAHHHRIIRQYESANREAVDRGRGDHAHILDAGQRHLQGARNRRRGQGQHVNIGAQPLQLFLMSDPEMLFLVHHQKHEIVERDIFTQQRVRADHDIDLARCEGALGLGRLTRRHQTGELRDPRRGAGEAFLEGREMLAAQQRRRHHHRDLTAGHDGIESRAQGDLRFAETHIAANQPVHRPTRIEIGDGVGDRAMLVTGLVIGKARAKFLIQPIRWRDTRRGLKGALGRDLDEFAGHLKQMFLQPRLPRLPAGAAQPVELGNPFAGTEARQHLDILHRHVEAVVPGIGQLQTIVRRGADDDRFQTLVAADAVLDMDHQIARRKIAGIADKIFGAAFFRGRPDQPVAENVLLPQHNEIGRDEAVFDGQDRDRHRFRRQGDGFGPAIGRREPADVMIAEELAQPLTRAVGIAGDDHASAAFMFGGDELANGIKNVLLAFLATHAALAAGAGPRCCEIGRAASAQVGDAGITFMSAALGCGKRREFARRPIADMAIPFSGVEV